MSQWSVYIVQCRDGSLYAGISTDVAARVQRHNAGKGAAYTRSHRPVVLVWTEAVASESAARKREAEIKGWTRKEKLRLITTLPNP
ncbi:MAG: GIY-YIG nuclease family protein [Patescibacteria group bacterium]